MLKNLNFSFNKEESDLKNGGYTPVKKKNTKVNNYLEEKNKLINFKNVKLRTNSNNKSPDYRQEVNRVKKQIENDLYQYILQLKIEMKKSIDNANKKANNYEKELLKMSIMNSNLNDILYRLSNLENEYDIIKQDLQSTKSLELKNNESIKNTKQYIKEQFNNSHSIINELKESVNNIKNQQLQFEEKSNIYFSNKVNDENLIINKINDLFKEKENNINIMSNNLFKKFTDYSNQTENKLSSVNNSISEIKNKIERDDNNINLLNEIPNIKTITSSIDSQINSINTRIEEISKEKEDMKNNIISLRNDIQTTNSGVKEMNQLNNENKNIEKKNIENDLNEMKKNFNYLEKKVNNLNEAINNLNNNINDNKKEILQIKKNIDKKADIDFLKKESNINNNDNKDIYTKEFNEKINNLFLKFENNDKKFKDLEILFNNQIKEVNDDFKKLNKKMEEFNQEEVKLNIENHQLMKYISDKMIKNNKDVNDIVNDFNSIYSKLEIISKNFKETNKYFLKIKEIDKIVKDIINKMNSLNIEKKLDII